MTKPSMALSELAEKGAGAELTQCRLRIQVLAVITNEHDSVFENEPDPAEQPVRQIGAYLRRVDRAPGGPGGSRPQQRRSGPVPRPGGRPRSPEGSR